MNNKNEPNQAHRDRTYQEYLLRLVEERFGKPFPEMLFLSGNGRIPTPADLARTMIQMLEYYASVYEDSKDEPTKKLAEAIIREQWNRTKEPPHIRFVWMVIEMAPMTMQANLQQRAVARTLINMFAVSYPELAAKLDEELVQAALEATVRGDGRKYRGETPRWEALAEAWATTGDKKKPSTFKTDWFKEKRKSATLGRWLANR